MKQLKYSILIIVVGIITIQPFLHAEDNVRIAAPDVQSDTPGIQTGKSVSQNKPDTDKQPEPIVIKEREKYNKRTFIVPPEGYQVNYNEHQGNYTVLKTSEECEPVMKIFWDCKKRKWSYNELSIPYGKSMTLP
ncbi:hypothetical protein OO006_04410 [Prosthecochloris sp. SCSIO W1101]|uniref:hypothetical protein n=1 Tax=Prosthecochloris sp. SCSIO W1101 TaxID=2992242 RepID=UPI00223E82D6|nr:hypothetical protein [Prosthecochloris sp. SCSIO W1101]UZJ42224.1 hypothetical protein OO006_04410 [Prosthecochloris sp. SCSIO W1101]